TGNLFSDQDVQAIIEAAPGLVVLDEAYTAFTQYDSQKWLVEHRHVVIMRTVSKMGLAGLRLGFCFAHPAITNELEKVRLPYNINCLTQHTAEFILKHADILEAQTQALRKLRSQLNDQLSLFSCFEVFPSEANFLLVRVLPNELSAREIFTALKERGVLIKCLDGGHPLLAQCLRFTVGSEEENQALISALKDIYR
ncbi:MAG: aminotransferase class I/II-fold pyridoxal phosphate-dependent enzyme, partial [Pseudomonadota bacterium]|nr:aminotransferase class I/II-fold pyridoxal phosphate-dependent enzyme [Pseudomonadota bacterium]